MVTNHSRIDPYWKHFYYWNKHLLYSLFHFLLLLSEYQKERLIHDGGDQSMPEEDNQSISISYMREIEYILTE